MVRRLLCLGLGGLSLAAGGVGIFVPLLPTVPLWILAAFCLGRGSPRLQAYILRHPRFGPPVRDYLEHGGLTTRHRRAALAGLALSALLVLAVLWGRPVLPFVLAILAAVAVYLHRLPEPAAPVAGGPPEHHDRLAG